MHGSVIRGDLNNIKIGYFSTIQENCVIHAARYDLSSFCQSNMSLSSVHGTGARLADQDPALSSPVLSLYFYGAEGFDSSAGVLLCLHCVAACLSLQSLGTIMCRNGPTGLPAATFIGEAVTVGAGSLLRSCRIHEQTVIGERCIIMEGSVVDAMVVLQPGTVVPPAKYIPSGELWGGSPARFIRKLTHDEVCSASTLIYYSTSMHGCQPWLHRDR